jgi:hypothetical protein
MRPSRVCDGSLHLILDWMRKRTFVPEYLPKVPLIEPTSTNRALHEMLALILWNLVDSRSHVLASGGTFTALSPSGPRSSEPVEQSDPPQYRPCRGEL